MSDMRLVLVSKRSNQLAEFVEALRQQNGVELLAAENGRQALEIVRENAPAAVIIDAEPTDAEPLQLVKDVLLENAMVHCVVGSPLSEDDFHEASEGLGVAAQLPKNPTAGDAQELVDILRGLVG